MKIEGEGKANEQIGQAKEPQKNVRGFAFDSPTVAALPQPSKEVVKASIDESQKAKIRNLHPQLKSDAVELCTALICRIQHRRPKKDG